MASDRELAAREARRLEVQAALDSRKSALERNRLGQFATPPTLATEIARFARTLLRGRLRNLDFADPAVGSGAFFSAACRVFTSKKLSSSTGVELDPAFAATARELWEDFGLHVLEGDFTDPATLEGSVARPNLILTNPPYVRHHHISSEQKTRLQARLVRELGVQASGLAGLYVYFLLLATAWMSDDGLAIWLIPSEFMDVNYGEVLRRFLAERVSLVRIHRFDPNEVQFDDALVSSAIVVFRKKPPAPGTSAQFTFGGSLAKPHLEEEIQLRRLADEGKWTRFPRSGGDRAELSASGLLLGDLFKIQRGLATGANRVFILSREEAVRHGLPERFLRPILPSPRHLSGTVVEAEEDGYPKLDRQFCLIDCDLPELQVREKYPLLWSYLQDAEKQGARDRYLSQKRSPWYRQERRAPAPFLCTYMGRGAEDARPFRFIWNCSDATATNLYLLLYPVGHLAGALERDPQLLAKLFEMLCRITGQNLRQAGRVYGGGLHKIEPRELAQVAVGSLLRDLGLEEQVTAPTLFGQAATS
ncbi:MAG: Eco57I restriction-modification methylase domain-containing protein [Holophagales bacterium]|nr:MAG: Eco57I restriction-modification methylase domain-containing protein [Holophagales bacterium]